MEIEEVLLKTEPVDKDDEDDNCTIIEEGKQYEESGNEMPFKCGICGHRTTSDTLLKVHMKMHLVKRIHQCNICNRTFSFVTELNSHILTHSEGKSSFHCEVCDKDFFTQEDLHKHDRVHTKEKPFRCKLCFRAFSNLSYLRVHERSHHGEDYLKRNMMKDGTFVDPSLVRNLNEEEKPNVSDQKEMESKQTTKNESNLPLNGEEKLMLLKYIEEMGLHQKYSELEQIRAYLKSGWTKMVEMFSKNGFNRNQEKLQRTYFHLKNQAKTHIERYYKHKKLPLPHAIDYTFVKLYPSDFEHLGVDLDQILKDGQKIEKDNSASDGMEQNVEVKAESVEVKEEILLLPEVNTCNTYVSVLKDNRMSQTTEDHLMIDSRPGCSRKRCLLKENIDCPKKAFKTEYTEVENCDSDED